VQNSAENNGGLESAASLMMEGLMSNKMPLVMAAIRCEVKTATKESKVFCFFFSKKKILLPNCC
jgi:hypothetical protein